MHETRPNVEALIEKINGKVDVLASKFETFFAQMNAWKDNVVSKDEFVLTIREIKGDVADNRRLIDRVITIALWVGGAILLVILGMVLEQSIPGFRF